MEKELLAKNIVSALGDDLSLGLPCQLVQFIMGMYWSFELFVAQADG